MVAASMTLHYTRSDMVTVSLPCCNIVHIDDGLICRYQVYVDITPVFARVRDTRAG